MLHASIHTQILTVSMNKKTQHGSEPNMNKHGRATEIILEVVFGIVDSILTLQCCTIKTYAV